MATVDRGCKFYRLIRVRSGKFKITEQPEITAKFINLIVYKVICQNYKLLFSKL